MSANIENEKRQLEADPIEAIFELNMGDFLTEYLISDDLLDKINNSNHDKTEGLKKQLKELISVYSIDNTLNLLGFNNTDDFVIYNSIAKTTVNMLDIDACHIFLTNDNTNLIDIDNDLVLVGTSLDNSSEIFKQNIGFKFDDIENVIVKSFLINEIETIDNVDERKDWYPIEFLEENKVKSAVIVPMSSNSGKVGIIVLENYKGKKLLSYRERWFFARLNALFESQLYEECRELSLEAIKQYPRRIEFSRRAALCKMMLGKYGEAEEELQAISKMRGCPWYIVADLAKLRFNVGSFNRALESAFEATLMHGELQSKVNLFTLIAKIQLVLGNSESAKNHIMLACAIRKDLKWKFNEEITQLASRFGIGDKVPLTNLALKACEKEWRELTNNSSEKDENIRCNNSSDKDKNVNFNNEPVESALQGFITSILEDRPFTFIHRADNDQKIYTKISDIPEDMRLSGMEVEFDLVESFDKLKNKKSVRAVNIRAIKAEQAVA